MASFKLLTVFLLVFNIEGLLGDGVRSSIIGGDDANKGDWPWMAYVLATDGKKEWSCGGSIVSNQYVLTAASCFDQQTNYNIHRSMVWVGAHSLLKGGVRYLGITQVIPHPQYQRHASGYVNNIALLKLKKKLTFSNLVKAISLPNSHDTFDSTSQCWITGWGNIKNGVPLGGEKILQALKISIILQSDCKAVYPTLTDNMLCAGDMNGGKDACTGDYGGPLVCGAKSGGSVQVGIMSYGSPQGCGLPGRPGVYTRVSDYLLFIKNHIQGDVETSAEV